ncbi:hypothetical protein PIB30_027147 [Stylosanthes scabra]|uniref:Uncharacterized protein n=1 Tax=Stylosanthes scabra TaxID=79078 RepID=A0ABU6Z7C9_9FABA|nr:hypothetical protein [Stylosanthes scabra]
MRLTEDRASEGDYVLGAAGLFDRLPFRVAEDMTHFLWVYQELFTRLRVHLPFSDFQNEVMTRFRVAASQLHLNGFLLSLPEGLGKKHKFTCHWILDHDDTEVGAFLDSLLDDMAKQNKLDCIKTMMADVSKMGPCTILPAPKKWVLRWILSDIFPGGCDRCFF